MILANTFNCAMLNVAVLASPTVVFLVVEKQEILSH